MPISPWYFWYIWDEIETIYLLFWLLLELYLTIILDTHSFIRYILHFSLWIWREFNSNEVYEFILFLPSLALILCIIRLLSDEKTFFFVSGGAGTHPAGTTTTTSTDLELKASISFPSTHNYFAYFYTYICFVLGLLDRWHFKNGF